MSVSISVSPVVFPELSLTSHNLSTVLDSMKDDLLEKFSDCVNIPKSEVERIRSKYSNAKERKQAAIDYLISSHPAPSWRLVANALYQMVINEYADSSLRALTCLQELFPTGIYIHTVYVYICTYVEKPVYSTLAKRQKINQKTHPNQPNNTHKTYIYIHTYTQTCIHSTEMLWECIPGKEHVLIYLYMLLYVHVIHCLSV